MTELEFQKLSWTEKVRVSPSEPQWADLLPYYQFMANREERIVRNNEWEPALTPKQRSVVTYPEKNILLSGCRHSTKTRALLNAIAHHCWTVPDASVAFVYVAQTNATDAGSWVTLCDEVMPEWINGNFGMRWIDEPRFTTYSHKAYFEVTNQFGGTAHVQIYSLPDERRAATMFKNKEFTMVVITELTNFQRPDTFDYLIETLRGAGRPSHHFKFMADTNPSEEGTASWIWKKWFPPQLKRPEEKDEAEKELRVITWTLDDNVFYTEKRKQQIRDTYKYDAIKYAINVLGEWKVVTIGTFFAEQFRYNVHVRPPVAEFDDEYLGVEPTCFELYNTADIGGGINHAAHIFEKANGVDKDGRPCIVYKILDEIISVGLAVGIKEFTQNWTQRMDFWEQEVKEVCGRSVIWRRHWSDADIFNFDSAASTYKHLIVYAESKNRIELSKVSKGPHSVAPRLDLIKKLLHDDRLFISRRCIRTIDALQRLKIEKRLRAGPVDPKDPCKHPIDSFSYGIYMENGDEALGEAVMATRRERERDGNANALVHVSI